MVPDGALAPATRVSKIAYRSAGDPRADASGYLRVCSDDSVLGLRSKGSKAPASFIHKKASCFS